MAKTQKVGEKGNKKDLDFVEQNSLQDIMDMREAIRELETALLPLAARVAKEQRRWWDKVLEARGLSRKDGNWTTDGQSVFLVNSEEEK